MKKLLAKVRHKALVFLACLLVAAPTTASAWSFGGAFKCPEAEVKFVVGGGIEVCIPNDVYHCIFDALPAGLMAFGQGVIRGRSGRPGGCTFWCIEVCIGIDLIIWSGGACERYGSGENCHTVDA